MGEVIFIEERRDRKARLDEGFRSDTEWLLSGGSEPPAGWCGTWTRQEPYLLRSERKESDHMPKIQDKETKSKTSYSKDSEKLYRPLSEKALRAFPKELSDILNFKKNMKAISEKLKIDHEDS